MGLRTSGKQGSCQDPEATWSKGNCGPTDLSPSPFLNTPACGSPWNFPSIVPQGPHLSWWPLCPFPPVFQTSLLQEICPCPRRYKYHPCIPPFFTSVVSHRIVDLACLSSVSSNFPLLVEVTPPPPACAAVCLAPCLELSRLSVQRLAGFSVKVSQIQLQFWAQMSILVTGTNRRSKAACLYT